MKVTVLLRGDHEVLQSLFNKFKIARALGKTGKKDMVREIQRQVAIHSKMESEVFYPALIATPSERATGLVSAAIERHQAVEKLLRELNDMSPSAPDFEITVDLLMEEIRSHIQIYEDEMFHEAHENLTEYRLEELGLEMQRRRNTLVRYATSDELIQSRGELDALR